MNACRVFGLAADAGRQVTAAGAYLTIWRREGDGWKVILDTGAPDPAP